MGTISAELFGMTPHQLALEYEKEAGNDRDVDWFYTKRVYERLTGQDCELVFLEGEVIPCVGVGQDSLGNWLAVTDGGAVVQVYPQELGYLPISLAGDE